MRRVDEKERHIEHNASYGKMITYLNIPYVSRTLHLVPTCHRRFFSV